MEKNPVSFLQEFTVNNYKYTPNYSVLFENSGTHENTFTYQVKCREKTAEGTGTSKKDAKAKAATKMIEIFKKEVPSYFRHVSYNTTVSEPSSSTLTNYVGKLQVCFISYYFIHINLLLIAKK